MKKDDCFYLGRIVSKFSFKGEILAKLDSDNPRQYETLDAVFIDFGPDLVPFIVERARLHKSELLRLKLEDVNDEEDAEALMKRDLFLPLELLPVLNDDQFYYHEITGFQVIDQSYGLVGKLIKVNDQGSQPIMEIENQDRKVLIPLLDEFLVRVDKKERVIYVNAPEGLIRLYLDTDE